MVTQLYPFQERGVRKIERLKGRCLLGDEMGLGKTIQSLAYLARHPEARPAIIVCPASLRWNWEREAKAHVGLRAQVLEGTRPQAHLLRHNRLLVVNYDVLYAWLPLLQKLQPQAVVLDECHYTMSPSARRSKSAYLLCQGVPHVVGLSGTPLTNRPIELWHPLRIIRPELFPNRIQYAVRYCKRRRTPWGWDETGACNLEELNEVLRRGRDGVPGVLIRRRKAQVLKELPAKTRTVVPLDIDNRGEYDEAVRDFIGWLRRKAPHRLRGAVRAQAITKLGYLRKLVAQGKLRAIIRWIDDFQAGGDKLAVYGVHRSIIRFGLYAHYGRAGVLIDGGVMGKARQDAFDQFLNHPRTRLLFGNIKAGGVGLSGKGVTNMALAEFPWAPGDVEQVEDRFHGVGRGSTTLPTNCYWLIGRGTLEEDHVRLLARKARTLNAVLDGGQGASFDVVEKLTQSLLKTGGKR